jgi:hypothetical protein
MRMALRRTPQLCGRLEIGLRASGVLPEFPSQIFLRAQSSQSAAQSLPAQSSQWVPSSGSFLARLIASCRYGTAPQWVPPRSSLQPAYLPSCRYGTGLSWVPPSSYHPASLVAVLSLRHRLVSLDEPYKTLIDEMSYKEKLPCTTFLRGAMAGGGPSPLLLSSSFKPTEAQSRSMPMLIAKSNGRLPHLPI